MEQKICWNFFKGFLEVGVNDQAAAKFGHVYIEELRSSFTQFSDWFVDPGVAAKNVVDFEGALARSGQTEL